MISEDLRAAYLAPKLVADMAHAETIEPEAPWHGKRYKVIAVMDMK